jgi:hypothetical protein
MTAQPRIERDTHAKALALNLDNSIYGTFAEIGAGQEVARWFLTVGAASGTVANTISAYDKTVSDDIYGASTRYVSKERLQAMLDCEYKLLLQRLGAARGESTRYFVFADTVAARNYQGSNEQHGWAGLRFQSEPGSEPSQVLLHMNLRDSTAALQQAAIGILGVNLIYAAFRQGSSVDTFLTGLFDELSARRIEIDVIQLDGPAFATQDSAEWCLALLSHKMAHGIVLNCGAGVVEPASVLRKRPLIVLRGTFNHPELLDPALMERARRQLLAEGAPFEREPAALLEMTIHHVSRATAFSATEILQRIRQLSPSCATIVSDFPETYLLSRYLSRYSTEPVRFVMSIAAAAKVLHEAFYHDLPGTLLEGLGRLLATNVKLYVAPMPRIAFEAALRDMSATVAIKPSGKSVIGLDDLAPAAPACHLVEYLRATGRIVALDHSG